MEWVLSVAISEDWQNFLFSSDALQVVKDMKWGEYHIRDQVLLIRKQLAVNGWSMVWNARSSNRFANALAKKAMSSLCNFSFSSSNLICLLDDLSKILMADMAGINISL